MDNEKLIFTRRGFGIGLVGGAASLALPVLPASALTMDHAKDLVARIVDEVNITINSGKSTDAMAEDFHAILARHADLETIARSALGPAAKSLNSAKMVAFKKAFQHHLARSYSARFHEFTGGKVEVTGTRALKSHDEVLSVVKLHGKLPFELRWQISGISGKPLFLNVIVNDRNILSEERAEISAMLERHGGSIQTVIDELNQA